MKYTKEQRRDIYLKAAERMMGRERFICEALDSVTGYGWSKDREHYTMTDIKPMFPEFALFDPNNGLCWFGNESKKNTWSEEAKAERSARITCLLFCAEMCK